MSRHPRARGFTLIELLIVIAIIGIIAALILPNFLESLQKAKQKRSMGQIKIVGTAMMAWLTDQAGSAAAAGASTATVDLSTIAPIDAEDLAGVLVPAYIQEIPEQDAWHEPLRFHLAEDDPYGVNVLAARSLGRDRTSQGPEYTVGAFEPTDYDQDLVWVDGGFIRWPQTGAGS